MGASLGLWHLLMTLEKEPKVIVPSPPPNFLMWMPGADQVLIYTFQKEEAERIIEKADLIIAVDFNTPSRLGKLADSVIASKARKVMIDHHLNPDRDFANIIISYPQISSTSELIFRLICRMGHFSDINLGCAESIYTGMMTDTGGFTFNSNHEEIYLIIYELIKRALIKTLFTDAFYDTFSEHRMRLQGYCIYKNENLSRISAALITLTKKKK